MEEISNLAHNRHIHLVLKAFQGAAMHSLRGPSRYSASWADPTKMSATDIEEYKKVMSEFLKQDLTDTTKSTVTTGYQLPFLFPMDNTRSEKSETTLEGETISCFVVGGEKRLCLPQVLNLLRPFSMDQVYEACNELHIFFSRCNLEQLHILKLSGILPQNAQNCGLITKTDAERLCHRLLYSCPEKSKNPTTPNSFKVYHECFGKCKGIFVPELYYHPKAKCIQCCDCEGVFSPPNFVCHSHKSLENRTCHWGFDSANWRSYLLLAKEQDHIKAIEKQFEEIKSKFDLKRKESSDSDEQDKKAKYDSHTEGEGILQQLSVLAPWKASLPSEDLPAFLQKHGPPVILNPERVVPFSSAEKQRDSFHFAPNVSLAPASHQKPSSSSASSALQQKAAGNSESAEDLTKHSGDLTIDNTAAKKREDRDVFKHHLRHQQPSTAGDAGDKDSRASSENLDIDVSTSSETDVVSSNSDSGVSTPTEKCSSSGSSSRLSQLSLSESICEREQELKMLRLALDGRVGETETAKEEFIEDFMRLRIREDIRMRQLENAKRDLQKELEFVKFAKKQKIQELTEAKKTLKREVERLRIERDVKAHELLDERKLTKQQIDTALSSKMPNVLKLKAYYKSRIDGLKTKLNQHEQMHIQMCEEIDLLREQLRCFGKDVPDIKYEIAADDPTLMAALNSPLENKAENCFRFIVKDEKVEPSSSKKELTIQNEELDTSSTTTEKQENKQVKDEWKIPSDGVEFSVKSEKKSTEPIENTDLLEGKGKLPRDKPDSISSV